MNFPKWYGQYCTDSKLHYPSERTQDNYQCSVGTFLKYFEKAIDPQHISTQEIKEWLLTFATINTRNHKLCAIKSFYQITVGMPLKLDKIPFSKKDKKLPIPLSQDETQRTPAACENLKHKAILAVLYGCGLRVSELINLKWTNLDRDRKVINIIAAKGKKDRQVPLPDSLIPVLEAYYHQYKSVDYVFNGQNSAQYTSSSVGEVVKQLAAKAGIKNKHVYTHLIRHTNATHLVENGTDINIIQRQLGHSSPKTTAIYTHISHSIISKINSPLGAIKL